jgi:hypothetical protein
MTEPRPIPNNCLEAMNRTAERSDKIIRAMEPLISGKKITDEEKMRRFALVVVHATLTKSAMEELGAKSTSSINNDVFLEAII